MVLKSKITLSVLFCTLLLSVFLLKLLSTKTGPTEQVSCKDLSDIINATVEHLAASNSFLHESGRDELSVVLDTNASAMHMALKQEREWFFPQLNLLYGRPQSAVIANDVKKNLSRLFSGSYAVSNSNSCNIVKYVGEVDYDDPGLLGESAFSVSGITIFSVNGRKCSMLVISHITPPSSPSVGGYAVILKFEGKSWQVVASTNLYSRD
jgi:hypothetical protein